MINRIKSATYLKKFEILIHYKNGEERILDMEPFLNGKIFEPLRDLQYFKKLKVTKEGDTIEWPNGADMAPETLYSRSISVSKIASAAGN